jgi:YD repeat-containing protein
MGALSRGGGRWLLLVVLVMSGFVGLALDGVQSSADETGQQAATAAHDRTDALLGGAVAVPSLATETSKTYRRPDGRFVTRIFSQPADANPSLQPAAGGGYEAEGHGAATTRFPDSLADPITVTSGEASVSMQLVGGDGTARPNGSAITYDNALPGVSVTYKASDGAVGEDLHLDRAGAPSRYVFEVKASEGVHAASQANGTIAFTDADGRRVISLSPSFAFADRDPTATEKVATALAPLDGGGWRVTLSVDEGWLRDALAGGPVTIDPTVELQGASKDCALTSDTPTLSFCSGTQLWVGWSGDHDHHSLVKWDVSAIPKDALILTGDAGLYQSGGTAPVAKQISIHRLTRDWTNGASWNTYDGTHAWTTPGGDYDPSPAASATVPANDNGWTDWYATALVQRWVDGSLANYGILVRDQSATHIVGENDFGSTEGMSAATAPELDVIWTTRGGAPDPYTFESQSVDAKTSAAVNAANGNLLLSTKDLAIPGTGGLDLNFARSYNSIADPTAIGGVGLQTTGSFGRDVSLRPLYGPGLAFSRGDGLLVAFSDPHTAGTTKTYTAPADLPGAMLTQNTTTHLYTLDLPTGLPAWPGLHLALTFDPNGALTKIADTAGHHLDLDYYPSGYTDPPAVGGIVDTNNSRYDIDRSNDGEESIDNIADPSDTQHWTFSYDSVFGTLTKATSIDNTNYQYAYDSQHRLNKVTTPTGAVWLVTYNGSTSKVASIVQTTNTAHTTGPTTTFTYSSPTTPCQSTNFDYTKTVVQRPNTTSTTYCANDHAQVTYDTDNPTAATPSGEWYDLHDQYTRGVGTHSITLTGADAGAGIKKLALERGSGTEVASTTLPCDPRNATNPTACPHASVATTSFDPSAIPEGTQAFRVRATDYAGRARVSPDWVLSIDRTGPVFDSGFTVTAGLDSASEAIVRWDAADDPDLADGTMPSGMANYLFRWLHAGGSWSAWATTTTESGTVPGSHDGESIALQIVPVDQVGNQGATKSVSVTVAGTAAPCDDTANGIPSDCVADPSTQAEEDAGLEDPVTLTPEPASGGSGIAPLASVPATRYTATVGGGGWGTIRRKPNSYVLGNIKDGWSIDVQDGSLNNGSIQGRILGQFGDCGWIYSRGLDDPSNTTTGCQLSASSPPPPHDFADKLNCTGCNAGSATRVLHAFPFCPNVDPTPLNHQPKTCLSPINSRFTSADASHGVEYTVYWRYITNGGRFVLVNDKSHGYRRTDATWVFIDRRALRKNLCTRETTAGRYRCGTV